LQRVRPRNTMKRSSFQIPSSTGPYLESLDFLCNSGPWAARSKFTAKRNELSSYSESALEARNYFLNVMKGLETAKPFLQIGGNTFRGEHETLIGTEVIFQEPSASSDLSVIIS
jgi:TFIIIC subunit triple barrel domain